MPFLRYVGLNGSLVHGSAKASSDIDLMIVAEPGHIYTVRFFVVSALAIVGVKRTKGHIAGRLCPNYFITTDDLDIKPHNRRVAEAYQYQVALIDSRFMIQESGMGYYGLIMQKNKWMQKYRVLISSEQARLNSSIGPVGEPWQTVRLILEIILFPVADILENILRKLQLVKIKHNPLTKTNTDKIIATDKELMFHPRKQ